MSSFEHSCLKGDFLWTRLSSLEQLSNNGFEEDFFIDGRLIANQ